MFSKELLLTGAIVHRKLPWIACIILSKKSIVIMAFSAWKRNNNISGLPEN